MVEHISAVIFSNTGTVGKFTRMGFSRFGNPDSSIARIGALRNPDPEIRHATAFAYDLRQPMIDERWTDGLVVMHNPNALTPLPMRAFSGVAQVWLDEHGVRHEDFPEDMVFSSVTAQLTNPTQPFRPLRIEAIAKSEGRRLALPLPDIVTADYWFSDPARKVLGVITQDTEEPALWRAWRMVPGEDRRFYPDTSFVFENDQQAADCIQEWLSLAVFSSAVGPKSPEWIPLLFPHAFRAFSKRRDTESKE